MMKCTHCDCDQNGRAITLFCNNCNKMIPLEGQKRPFFFFAIFDLEVTPEPDINIIEKKYAELIRECHPDRFMSSTTEVKKMAFENSSIINEAHNILTSPLEVCRYIIVESEKDIESSISDMSIINESLALHEELNSLKTYSQCSSFAVKINKILESKIKNMQGAISIKNIMLAKDIMNSIRFIERIIIAVGEKLKELEKSDMKKTMIVS